MQKTKEIKSLLQKLFNELTEDQKKKDIIEIEYSSEYKKLLQINMEYKKENNNILFSSPTNLVEKEGDITLVYKNSSGKLVIKPKFINLFLKDGFN